MAHQHVAGSLHAHVRSAVGLSGLALRLAWQASPRLLAGIVLFMALQALLRPLQLGLSRVVIDRAALDLGLTTPPDRLAAALPLLAWIVASAAALAAGQLLQSAATSFQDMAGDRLTGYVTERVIRTVSRWQGLARFEDPSFADDLERVRSHAALSGLTLLLFGGRLITLVVIAGSTAIILVGLHPLCPLLQLLATFPQMARHWEYRQRTTSHLYVEAAETRRLQYSRAALLDPEPAKDVRLYGLGSFFRRQYDDIFARTMGPLNLLRRRLVAQVSLAGSLAAGASGVVYLAVVWAIMQGTRTLGDLALYGGAATLLSATLLGLASESSVVAEQFAFLPSLFRVLDAPPDLPAGGGRSYPAPRPFRHGITFEHVAFAYPGRAEPALRDISFHLAPGECLALVGHNGAGKTTLVKLLLRLYDPTAGRILVDGRDLRDYDLDDLRRQVGVIFQDFVRYELTVAENVGIGRVEALEDGARLVEAAQRAGASTLIDQLERGWDTPLGRQFGGRDLSGGEWQKLALARAFLRDSQLLVLDEPTAALDVQTEFEVYARFRELSAMSYQPSAIGGPRGPLSAEGARMTLLISHRFSTVRMADRILYLADGTVQEEGSHADLLARDGEYARLYQLQASQFGVVAT